MNSSAVTINVGGYTAEYEHDGERGQCFVSYGRYSSSLAALSDLGHLIDGRDQEHHVPAWVIGQIELWALAHGY